jgi:hypothetical protein
VIEREVSTCDVADDQRLAIATYEIHLARGRLHVATTRGDLVHDHVYADWRVTKGAGDGACVYEPTLAAAALDEASRVLVIRADHCPASDQCDDVLAAGFAVVRLPD